MNRFKKITLWTLGIILIFIAQGVILTIIYEKEIKQAAVTEINKSLNTKIRVETIQVKYWKHFPYISLIFENTIIPGSLPKSSLNLLEAHEIALLFNFWDLYQGKFKVHQLNIKDAKWNSVYNLQGASNFDILKASDSDQATSFKIDLKKVFLENVQINHYDQKAKDQLQFYIASGTAKGLFSNQSLEINLSSTGHAQSITLSGTNYIKNKSLLINGKLHVNLENNTYRFLNTRIQLEQLGTLVNGSYAYDSEQSIYNLQLDGDQIELEQLKDFAPTALQKKLEEYEGSGKVELQCSIKGNYSATATPKINVDAKVEDATITLKTASAKANIKNLGATFSYSNRGTGTQSDDYMYLEKISASLNDQKLQGFLKITQLNEPLVELKVITKQELKNVAPFISDNRVTPTSGEIDVDIYLRGAYRDMISNNRFAEIESKGSIKFHDANFAIKDSKIGLDNVNAKLQFERFDLKIEELKFGIGKSDFRVEGYFRNVLASLFQEEQAFEADLLIASKHVDLYELLSSNTKTDETFKLYLSKSVAAKIKFDVKELHFNKFKSNNLIGDIKIKNQIISSDYFAFRSQEGLVFSTMYFNTQNPKAMPMAIDFHLEKIDIHQMFYEFNDFGLAIITNKNIFGNVTTDMHVDMMWDENLNSDLSSFYAKGNIIIDNGKLLKFDPLLALSKYIDINELVDLRFSKMENTIEIKNQVIFIPNMHVSSNAIDMDLSGTHNFDNIVDYHIRVLLSDLLWKKSKRNNDSQFGEIENDGTGKSSLFIRMYGPADNPKFSLDKLMIKKKIKEDLQKEKSIVKDVLKEEFKGWFKKDQEFREQQNEIPEPWETDLPKKTAPKVDKTKSDSTSKKSRLSKLKEKLSEPLEEDE